MGQLSARTGAVETFRRNVSTRGARWATIALLWAIIAGTLAACGVGNGNPIPTGSDGALLTRITFVNKDGSEVDLLVEVADAPEERTRGLMFRESLPEDQGMLFVYEQEAQHSFWMQNTLIPLSIAFIEGEGDVVDIQDMEPLSEESHVGAEPYLYTVEANQGWFERNGIAAGSQVRIARTTPGQ